jgi:hypothetical protein
MFAAHLSAAVDPAVALGGGIVRVKDGAVDRLAEVVDFVAQHFFYFLADLPACSACSLFW